MAYYADSKNHYSKQAMCAASHGLMHFSECVTDGVDPDREFFKTREEAEASAIGKSGFDKLCGISFDYEPRSMWFDEDGDLLIAEDEQEAEG